MLLPIRRDPHTNRLSLIGNFCSWNCAKSFVYSKGPRKPQGVHYLWLLSFLTVHRPRYCPSLSSYHPVECPCLEIPNTIELTPPKEMLQAFGGSMSIQEFRTNSLTIDKYEWLFQFLNYHKYSYEFMEQPEPVYRSTSAPLLSTSLPPRVFTKSKKPRMGSIL